MKVIFLDVDGVLNCQKTEAKCRGFIGVDSKKVKLLKKIVDATDAKIVLSSSWKIGWWKYHKEDQDQEGHYLDQKLKREGLRIIDKTTDPDCERRGEGILNWLDDHIVESFVILDDEVFDYEQCNIMDRLVKTSFYDDDGGLQERHVEQAINILRGGHKSKWIL